MKQDSGGGDNTRMKKALHSGVHVEDMNRQ
jgi:hypothetical protein